MHATFLQYLEQDLELSKKHKTLLAVSGGIDSMVMQYLFKENGYRHAIAHCNFNLRGDESDKDEQFVIEHAKKNKVPVFTKTFNTEEYAIENNQSVQMAARELRYKWFRKLAIEKEFDFIAVASHKSDVLETMLINLTRGTGIAGLHGILPKRGNIIRPLLFASKEEIIAFAKANKINYREDSSNHSTKYMRNKIRQKIIPVLKELNPKIEENTIQTANQILQFEKAFKEVVKEKRTRIIQQNGNTQSIQIAELKKLTPTEVWLYELLLPFGFNGTVIKNILKAISSQPGKNFYSDNYRLVIDRNELIIAPLRKIEHPKSIEITEETTSVDEPIKLRITKNKSKKTIINDPTTAQLDLEKITFPMTIRKWKPGDIFQPLGMQGKKKLSDFLVDRKIPLTEKDHTFVLETAGEICWVVGHQIDERFKITDSTSNLLKVEIIE